MSRKRLVWTLVTALSIPFSAAADRVPGDAPITASQADAILDELKQIRQLLGQMVQRGQRPVPSVPPSPVSPAGDRPSHGPPLSARVSIQDRPVQGEPDAPITLVEFVDYECPYCRRFFNSAYGQLKRQYIDPGQVRLVVKDMPLPFHKQARKAAQAAHFAGEQNSFWRMHDQLYGGEAGLNEGALLAYAERLDLNQEAFTACLTSDRHMDQIDADIAEATVVGIPGTPAFVLGRSGDNEVEGAHIRGALPFGVFQAHIERLLGQGLDSRK